MGVKNSKIHPMSSDNPMMANILSDRSNLASIPSPDNSARLTNGFQRPGFFDQIGSETESSQPGTGNSSGFRSPYPSTGNSGRSLGSSQASAATTTVPTTIRIQFREPLCSLRSRRVKIIPKDESTLEDGLCFPEVVDNQEVGIINVETPYEKIIVSEVKKWQIFPGGSQFCLNGKLIFSPDRKWFYCSFFLLNLFFGAFAYFVLPYLMAQVSFFLTVPIGLLYGFCSATMLYAAYTDPGIIPRATQPEMEYYKKKHKSLIHPSGIQPSIKVDVNGKDVIVRWCQTCHFYKPPRATHCRMCDNCVERFDHHCPFIGNCVGQRNYPSFFMFLISILASCLFVMSCCGTFVYFKQHSTGGLVVVAYESSIGACIIGGATFIVFIPVGVLFTMHYKFVTQELTTNEDIKRHTNDNPYNRGSKWKNCLHVLCSPRIPSLLQSEAYVSKEYLESLYYHEAVKKACAKKYGKKDKDSENITNNGVGSERLSTPSSLQQNNKLNNNYIYNNGSDYPRQPPSSMGHSSIAPPASSEGSARAYYINNEFLQNQSHYLAALYGMQNETSRENNFFRFNKPEHEERDSSFPLTTISTTAGIIRNPSSRDISRGAAGDSVRRPSSPFSIKPNKPRIVESPPMSGSSSSGIFGKDGLKKLEFEISPGSTLQFQLTRSPNSPNYNRNNHPSAASPRFLNSENNRNRPTIISSSSSVRDRVTNIEQQTFI